MKTRSTIFDAHISTVANILNAAVKVDEEHHIPEDISATSANWL